MNEASIIVCRCEEVTLEQIRETIRQHGCSARETKLRTRAGMGICGGRICRPLLDRLAIKPGGDFPSELPLKVQPPVRPVSFTDWGQS
ncbi:bacterioferritin-associated ferredoxin [Paenibacillus endophyticus]|uniref:Bacterioferritin-associated ferredoxin n=1 Tax=Paenibacillus endophyticus TaxID=1294268 RepID=A0A7W5CBJ2_9BACL|nr:(2Fe-2S)-binding protein [Paenibacillus endophyticus]MBB3154686.1 bacterioferritin-associated ferredoxin [Paenibacillus endophyticus]